MSRSGVFADDRAARVLVYYLKTLWERAGMEWTADNEAEVRSIIEDVLGAANNATR